MCVCVCYLTDRLFQVVSPDVDVAQSWVNFHGLSQRQKTLRPDVVTADRQPEDRRTDRQSYDYSVLTFKSPSNESNLRRNQT